MKYILTILLLHANFVLFAQTKDRVTGNLLIQGTIITEGKTVEKNSLIIVTDKTNEERIFSWPISLDSVGQFEIENLQEGIYKLNVRVNSKEFLPTDTTITLTKSDNNYIKIYLDKKPCNYDAKQDIKSKEMKILVAGGISPTMNSKKDRRFEKKYGVKYVIFGDAMIEGKSCLQDYNYEIFNYLDRQFGSRWRNKVRKSTF